MTIHWGDYELGTVLDTGVRPRALAEHATRCRDCGDALDRMLEKHDRIGAMLCLLDRPADPVSFAAIEARALAASPLTVTLRPPERPITSATPFRDPVSFWNPRATGRRRIAWRRGALGFLVAAGVAAAAVPATPVRQFVASLIHAGVHQRTMRSVGSPQAAASGRPPLSIARGVAITPRSGKPVLVWRVAQPRGVIRVRPSVAGSLPVSRVSVLANGDGVIYQVSGDTIYVDNRAAPGVSFEVDVPPPSALVAITLLVADQSVFDQRGRTLNTRAPRAPDGSYTIPLIAQREPRR
jgi:hypothetical protein